MPFSPQPKKKGMAVPQGGQSPSCGHTPRKKDCPVCNPSAKVIDLPTEKKRIAALQENIFKKLAADSQATQKAALILSFWINKKR